MEMELSMAATLIATSRPRFSKTARSRPHHRDAIGRRRDRPRPAAVLRGRLADDVAERAAEGPEAGEADVEADLGHAAVALAQQEHRALHAPALQVPVWRLAERRAEGADEVRLGDVGDARQRRDVERLGVRAVHHVARAKEAAIGFLDGAAHPRMTAR